jgi:hypothetical protein
MSSTTSPKTVKKLKFPPLKPKKKCCPLSGWRYVTAEEWARRQTREEEYSVIATWTNALETAQRVTHRPLSPTPPGFNHNQGHHYIPFRVPTANGQGVTNAKYICVRMGVNPMADGCMYRGGVVHSGEVHATAERDRGATPDYTHEQLRHFCSGYSCRHEVDDALERIGDKSLMAEVSQFCGTMDTLEHLNKEILELEEELYCTGNNNCKCVCHLKWAHALIRVFEEEEVTNGLRVITPWVVECCLSHEQLRVY